MARAAKWTEYPINTEEFWALGLVRLPGWVNQPGGPPYRVWAGLCAGPELGIEMSDPVSPAEKSPALMEAAFLRAAGQAQRLPGQIHCWDEAHAGHLVQLIRDSGLSIQVMVGERYPAIDKILEEMAGFGHDKPPLPGLLSRGDVTLEHIRAFADAAAQFCRAQPWIVFDSDEDLIRVESPAVPPLLRHLVVLGRSGQEYGVGFYESESEFFRTRDGLMTPAQMNRISRVFLSHAFPHELPFPDADLWEDHNLPLVEGKTLLPVILHPKVVERPDAGMLALLEGIVRALAVSAEADLDEQTWSREVSTHAGPLTVKFSLVTPPAPARRSFTRETMEQTLADIAELIAEGKLNKQGKISLANKRKKSRPAALTPRQQAQELIHSAWDAQGRLRVKLARQALAVWPDAADAYNILAEEFNSPHDALNFYSKGLAAARRDLGDKLIEESRGRFWGILETRPFMRALAGLAHAEWISGQHDQAILHAREALDLNPGDNQGVRYSLVCWLLTERRDQEAAALLKEYSEESAWWAWALALLAFRLGGDTETAREELHAARRVNAHVAPYLAGKKTLPFVFPGSYASGSKEEALLCGRDLLPAWNATPAARQWLLDQVPGKKRRT